MRTHPLALLLLVLTLGVACDDDDHDEACSIEAHTGCEDGLVCEEVGGEPTCIGPVEIRGRVFALANGAAVAGATVVALDANGSARSTTVRTDDAGVFALAIPTRRDADGRPLDPAVTLRADAAGFVHFPRAPRVALPVVLAGAATGEDEADHAWVVQGPATEIGLVTRPEVDGRTVSGEVEGGEPGVLVTATRGDRARSTAVTDAEGAFVLFDVPTGEVTITGWRQGLAVTPEAITDEGDVEGLVLASSTAGLVTVKGSVNIVNAPGGSMTTVILVPEVTFDPDRIAGEAPAGMRAVDVSSAFEIAGVPPGDYAVLAAFEDDDLVRDPDEGIGGTAVVHVTVGTEDPTDLGASFKVTGALAVVSPGAEGVETIDDPRPELRWADDSSEDGYDLWVYDALGELVYMRMGLDRVTGAETVSHRLEEPLERGTLYQFRVASFRDRQGGRTYISATEDLEGVFLLPAPEAESMGE